MNERSGELVPGSIDGKGMCKWQALASGCEITGWVDATGPDGKTGRYECAYRSV